ncbi:MAG: site-2 protease family protein [Burkholderiales bacterium]|nr:site-2 protease family protein [Burkholderiales bacterium]
MLNFFLIILFCLALHLFSIAAAGQATGVRVLELSIGMGPMVFRYKAFILKLIPLNGYVKFIDTRERVVSDADLPFAFDRLSTWRQIMVTLSGCAALLVLATVLLGTGAWQDFIALPAQYVMGAVSPFGTAQTLLLEAGRVIHTTALLSLLGIVAVKLAAFNLLPQAGSNGYYVLTVLVNRSGPGANHPYPGAFHKLVVFMTIAAMISWCLAIAYACWTHYGL